jgi:hypothetical protein
MDTLENAGYSAIPSLYDAGTTGFVSGDFSSGIGSKDDLFLVGLLESESSELYGPGNHPSGTVWNPKVSTGYLYINGDEYYLYSVKGTVTDTPTSGRLDIGTFDYEYPPKGSPIILTSGSSEFAEDEPFGKTYTYATFDSDATPNKYRRIYDLTDKKGWSYSRSSRYDYDIVEYEFVYDSMTFTFHSEPNGSQFDWYVMCFPSDVPVTVEYETSDDGVYIASGVDVNPLNNPLAYNSIVSVVDSAIVQHSVIDITNSYRSIIGSNDKAIIITRVVTHDGSPVIGLELEFSSDNGTFDPSTTETGLDGTAYTLLTAGSIDQDGVTFIAESEYIIGSGWLQFGKIS